MNKTLHTTKFLLLLFLGVFSNQLFGQGSTTPCPTEAFDAGILWANGCDFQNVRPAEYLGQPIQYVWIKSTAEGGNCEMSIPELLSLNVGEAYDDFIAAGGFNSTASPVIGTTSWSFVTDGNNDDLSFNVSEATDTTCYSRCARVVGCNSFYGEASTTIQPCSQILPVELARFDGKADGCNVDLSWSSTSEENFSHYELERSTDGRTFELAESIQSSGSPQGGHYYFYDKQAELTNYYRLKMIDFDLTYEYSKTIHVNSDCEIIKNITVFPNPVGEGFINVKVEAHQEAEQLISLVDVTGQEILKKKLMLKEGINTLQLDVSELPDRIYFIKAGQRTMSRFTKTSQR